MKRYPENATALERLEWYSEHDIVGGQALVQLLERLEENFHYGDEVIHPED